ncbi:rhomboid-like protein [Streptomyces sp. NPDC127063]|uniref:rhomboid-like protein n=1 Tax=Streptomyces sp. NPDC127063 TaxID=3347123 RepID=UPI003654B0F3
MERTARVETTPPDAPLPAVPPEVARLLDAMPGQPLRRRPGPSAATEPPAPATGPAAERTPRCTAALRDRLRTARPRRLLPTPAGTPFTFAYAVVLAVTSLVAAYADPAVVQALQQGSSTDVAHLVRHPVLVLVASALWIAGGVLSPYTLGFLLVLTALERRIGGLRTAGVFLCGHVLATLATEVPVGLAVLTGHLPDSSLHRLDYGISFGVATGVGALAGLLTPWLRWPLLAYLAAVLGQDLLSPYDPLTSWGHATALAIGVATWPALRRWADARQGGKGTGTRAGGPHEARAGRPHEARAGRPQGRGALRMTAPPESGDR